MTEKIKTAVIFILTIALAFLVGRGYESRYMSSVLSERSELYALKLRTEQLVNQNQDETAKRIFKQLGYEIEVKK